MPETNAAKLLVEQAVFQLLAVSVSLAALRNEMRALAASLPEYPVVMGMFGVGPALGPQLMAEIGDGAASTPKRRWWPLRALTPYYGSP